MNAPGQRSNRARRRRDQQSQNSQNGPNVFLQKYDAALSKQRLVTKGFDRRVSLLTPAQIEDNWARIVDAQLNKPSQEQWMARIASLNKKTSATKSNDFFLVSPSLTTNPSNQPEPLLVSHLLRHEHIGAKLIDFLWDEGFRAIQCLCTTSKAVLSCVQAHTSTWNLNSQGFENQGLSHVFVVFQPRLTVGEVIDQGKRVKKKPVPKCWMAAGLRSEQKMLNTATERKRTGGPCLSSPRLAKLFPGRDTVYLPGFSPHVPWTTLQDCNEMFTAIDDMQRIKQTSSKEHWEPYTLPIATAARSMRAFLSQIHLGSKVITNLQLHEIPLVDRRMVAIMLDECVNLTTLGIYNCPMLHFGDTVSFLDLIHTLNTKECSMGRSKISSFDFYPRYFGYRPYNRPRKPTLGLICSPAPLEIVQRGFFATILKAYLKSRAMKIKLLFDEHGWLRTFLGRVPNLPLAVVGFLDAIERWLTVRNCPRYNNTKVQAMYDLLKPVRLGLEVMVEDWPKWCEGLTEERVYFCSSCGYSMAPEFFSTHYGPVPNHQRVCCGCTLQRWLDQGRDSMRLEIHLLLGMFFPKWNHQAHNTDAPIPDSCHDMLHLQSTVSNRSPDQVILNDEGDIIFEPGPDTDALLRDNRIRGDSMIGLPPLREILEGKEADKIWKEVIEHLGNLDLYTRAARCFHKEVKERGWELHRNDILRALEAECDGCIVDEFDMMFLQRSELHRKQTNYDFPLALTMARALESKGW